MVRSELGAGGSDPIRVVDVDIARPLPPLSAADDRDARAYRRALVVVRAHGVPLGMLQLELDGELSSAQLAGAIRAALGEKVAEHLRADGDAVDDGMWRGQGTSSAGTPRCELERSRFLEHAPFLSLIIPTRERPERLARCLDSVLASGYPHSRYEIVVVDNAAETDRTAALVRDRYGAGCPVAVRYVTEDAPGSASARNRGMRVVEGDIVAFTDDDVVVDHDWLAEVARGLDRAPEAGCISGLLLPVELETPAQVWFEQYGGFSRGFERRVFDLGANRPADSPLYPYAAGIFGTGNNMAFRRDTLAAIGNFDPALGNGTPALGGVDSEVLLRTILEGHTIVYEPSALVWHAHRPDYEGLKRQVYSYGTGLTAYLLKTLLADPRRIPGFAARVPRGLKFALSSGSAKNEHKEGDYPSELSRLERRGMLYGPLAYARSRRRFGPHRVLAQR